MPGFQIIRKVPARFGDNLEASFKCQTAQTISLNISELLTICENSNISDCLQDMLKAR